MTNQEIKTVGQTIAQETQIGGNTAARVGGVVEGIGVALDNKDAANSYYQATISGGTITVNAPNYLLGTGGNLRIKMPSAGTTASTLTIGNANAVQLWYNGAAVSSDNTWEADEIISVFYDGTRFMASNSQGEGNGKVIIKPINGFYITSGVDTHGAIPSTPNTSGNNGLWYRCAKIEVNTGDVLLVSGAGSGYAAGRLWAFGDSNGNYMYGSEVSGTQTTVSLIIPEGVKWVVLNSKASANIEWYYAKRGSVYANILLEQQAINELISNTETTSLEPISVDYGNINGGYVSSSDGNIVQTPISSNYPYRYTNLIAVTKGQQIDTVVWGSAPVLTIAAYSSSNTTTAILGKSEVGNGTVQEKRYIVPEGVDYVRISFQSTHIIQFYVNIHNVSALNEKVDNLNDKVENIKKDILAFPIEPLETYAAKEYHDGTLSTVPNAICKKYDVENLDYVFVTTQWQSVDAGFYLVVFTDSSNATLSQLAPNQRNTGLTLTKQKFIIPDGAKYMYVNNRYGVDMPIVYRDNISIQEGISNLKKEISILFIGNSLTQDAVSYVPLLLRELAPNLKFKFYVWYNGGYTLAQQLSKFNNDSTCEIFSVCENGTGWLNSNNSVKMSTILSTYTFDIVCLQEYFNYQETANMGAFNGIIEYIENHYTYPFKVVTLFHQPLRSNADTVFARTKVGNALYLKETVAEDMIPSGIAIYRAMQTTLDSLGDQGHLSPDGTHAQEGLPCMIQAYVTAMWILNQVGIPISVNNASSVVDNNNYDYINVPGPNLGTGVVVGTTEQVRLSQLVAIKAFKEGKYFVNANLTEYTT